MEKRFSPDFPSQANSSPEETNRGGRAGKAPSRCGLPPRFGAFCTAPSDQNSTDCRVVVAPKARSSRVSRGAPPGTSRCTDVLVKTTKPSSSPSSDAWYAELGSASITTGAASGVGGGSTDDGARSAAEGVDGAAVTAAGGAGFSA